MEQDLGALNFRWAARIVDGLAAAGVGRIVISPGSRSTPLTLAALRHPDIAAEVILDERSAAFFALGLAKAEARPVALVCTSGSAVANWHPAVIEADRAGVPLILLSADRPPELLDCSANQTIDQTSLFGRALRGFHFLPPAEEMSDWLADLMAQCVSESLWPTPGPVQVNVPLREPLLPVAEVDAPARIAPCRVHLPRSRPEKDAVEKVVRRIEGREGVIVCAPQAMPAAAIARLAEALDVPVMADPLSGLRFGEHDRSRILAAYDLFLRASRARPEYVLRFGTLPVSKPLAQWIAAASPEEIVVATPGRWPDPSRRAGAMLVGDYEEVALALAEACEKKAPPAWTSTFLKEEAEARSAIARAEIPEAILIARCLDGLPSGSLLFVGNSMAIRDFDTFSGLGDKAVTVMGNRGASGIDGNLSTFLGAARSGRFARSLALVGDLTFLHDVGGLAAPRTDATIVVIANDGGAIFDYLPPGSRLEKSVYERAWLTPQSADVGAAARAFGWDHRLVEAKDLAEALARPGPSVLEFKVDRQGSVERHRALWQAQSLEVSR